MDRTQLQMQQPPPQLLGLPWPIPSAPVHFWLAHQPPFHRTKVSIGKRATLHFRDFSSLIAKKDHGLTQRMVCTEAARFFSAATSGVYRAGIFFLRSLHLSSARLRVAILQLLFQLARQTEISDNEKIHKDVTVCVAKKTEMA